MDKKAPRFGPKPQSCAPSCYLRDLFDLTGSLYPEKSLYRRIRSSRKLHQKGTLLSHNTPTAWNPSPEVVFVVTRFFGRKEPTPAGWDGFVIVWVTRRGAKEKQRKRSQPPGHSPTSGLGIRCSSYMNNCGSIIGSVTIACLKFSEIARSRGFFVGTNLEGNSQVQYAACLHQACEEKQCKCVVIDANMNMHLWLPPRCRLSLDDGFDHKNHTDNSQHDRCPTESPISQKPNMQSRTTTTASQLSGTNDRRRPITFLSTSKRSFFVS